MSSLYGLTRYILNFIPTDVKPCRLPEQCVIYKFMLHNAVIKNYYIFRSGLMYYMDDMRIDVSKCRPLFWNTCDRARKELTDTILPQRGCWITPYLQITFKDLSGNRLTSQFFFYRISTFFTYFTLYSILLYFLKWCKEFLTDETYFLNLKNEGPLINNR